MPLKTKWSVRRSKLKFVNLDNPIRPVEFSGADLDGTSIGETGSRLTMRRGCAYLSWLSPPHAMVSEGLDGIPAA